MTDLSDDLSDDNDCDDLSESDDDREHGRPSATTFVFSVVFTWADYGPCMTAFCGTFGTAVGAYERIAQLERDDAPFPSWSIRAVRPSDGEFHVFAARLDSRTITVANEGGQSGEDLPGGERRSA
jgi:hypothetical protein